MDNFCTLTPGFCVSRKGGTGGGGWGHPQGDVHMVSARLDCTTVKRGTDCGTDSFHRLTVSESML